MATFNVELKRVVDESYKIEIGRGLQRKLVEYILEEYPQKVSRYVIITDDIVKELYANEIKDFLKAQGLKVHLISFHAGECSKTRETKETIENTMLSLGCKRDTLIIAIGGGVVSDIAGFIAGTYCRGIPYINYATTVLAAADASIGGKTAVNTQIATNMIGLFNQPARVFIDTATWRSLSRRQFTSGLAETIKHAIISDYEFFEFLEKNVPEIIKEYGTADSDDNVKFNQTVDYIARKNCEIKYKVVVKDEYEHGMREMLNLGHTVGRAIEQYSEYALLHGEAVSVGIVSEVRLARMRGLVTEEEEERVINLLESARLPIRIPDYVDRTSLKKVMYTDKKTRDGKIRMVLQKGIGDVCWNEDGTAATFVSEEEIDDMLSLC